MSHLPNDVLTKVCKAAELVLASEHTIALTGAGSSTPSGVPDFRSADSGLWTRYSPMEVASLTTFRQQPEKFFRWLRPLAAQILKAEPNPSHMAFATLGQNGFIEAVITQNIDGLHQRAGAKVVIEVHGSLNTLTCIGCYQQYPSNGYIDAYIQQGEIPRCQVCDRILKPDVVLFEEQLPFEPWLKAREEIGKCDLLIVAGSSLVVMPVAGLPMKVIENQARVIIVNKTPTYIDDYAEVVIHGDVADILPAIAKEVLDV